MTYQRDLIKSGAPHPESLNPNSLATINITAAANCLMRELIICYPGLDIVQKNILFNQLSYLLRILTNPEYGILMRNDLIVALQILHRLPQCDQNNAFRSQHYPYVVATVALMLGTKFLDDTPFNNATWSNTWVISLDNKVPRTLDALSLINDTEMNLLKTLCFQVFDQAIYQEMEQTYEASILPPASRPGPGSKN